MNILLIDDTPDHLELLAEFISELRPHARIHQLRDGAQLRQHLEREPTDLVLIDLVMPSASGFDVVREIREVGRWNDLPIVAVSGLRRVDQREALHAAGFSDYLVKPYEFDELARVLDTHLPPS